MTFHWPVGLRNSPAWDQSLRVAAPREFRSERPNHFRPLAERASETLDCSSILTRLVAREDFIAFSRLERLKSYNVCLWAHFEKSIKSIWGSWKAAFTLGQMILAPHVLAYTVKPVFNGTWIKRKPVLNERNSMVPRIFHKNPYKITFIKRKLFNAETLQRGNSPTRKRFGVYQQHYISVTSFRQRTDSLIYITKDADSGWLHRSRQNDGRAGPTLAGCRVAVDTT
jgi:hypothetical protein